MPTQIQFNAGFYPVSIKTINFIFLASKKKRYQNKVTGLFLWKSPYLYKILYTIMVYSAAVLLFFRSKLAEVTSGITFSAAKIIERLANSGDAQSLPA